MKYLIIASEQDLAGMNIIEQLPQFGNFNIFIVNDEIIYSKSLTPEKTKDYDFIIFASKHQSAENRKTLSVHAPGNWRRAEFGGEEGKVCLTSAFFLKSTLKELKKNAEAIRLNYEVTLECTHHGPLIDKPCIFIEIGSTENEWRNRRAGFVVAKTISELIENFQEGEEGVTIGIGGPHYCPNFNKIQLNGDFAISHIIPNYSLPFTEGMLQEAIDKTTENVEMAILDWKGIKNSEERRRIIGILHENGIPHQRSSDIQKSKEKPLKPYN